MNRQQYADKHRSRYLYWCHQVADSPYTALDKAEFALISAHVPQAQAINGFLATRGHHTKEELFGALYGAGVFAPQVKAERLIALRRAIRGGEITLPTDAAQFEPFRVNVKVAGLGYCKLSFALALIAPMESPVVCLDTHLCRAYGVKPDWAYRKLENYVSVESRLRAEADAVGLPPFAYQWATWDYQRRYENSQGRQAPDNHSFLWKSGRTFYQMQWLDYTTGELKVSS